MVNDIPMPPASKSEVMVILRLAFFQVRNLTQFPFFLRTLPPGRTSSGRALLARNKDLVAVVTVPTREVRF